MWKFASSLLNRLPGISPLKSFFKFLFRRISDDFFDTEPDFDIKNGVLELENLPLSTTKINSTFLASSPYVLHEGTIRRVKIILPTITELATKSVEVYLSGLFITLKPNKEFEARFNEKIKQIREHNKFYGGEDPVRENVSTGDEMDFFKEIIKQILTNIKVTVENVGVRIFMNRPTEKNAPQKPQYFLMLRMPLCQVEKAQDQESAIAGSKTSEQIEKFRVDIPQVSLHLLREDMSIPEYANVPAKQQDFPFEYPSVNHPSTLMLLGSSKIESHVESSTQSVPSRKGLTVWLRIKRDQKLKKIDNNIKVELPSLELMVEGWQLQILKKFAEQMKDFQVLYSRSMSSLKEQDRSLYKLVSLEQSQDLDIKGSSEGRGSISLNASVDIFASMMLKREESGKSLRSSRQFHRDSYLDSMLSSQAGKQLKKELKEFEANISQQDKHKIIENADDNFRSESTMKVEVELLCVYLLKYSTSGLTDYERVWLGSSGSKKPKKLHDQLPCSYFMLRIRGVAAENNPTSFVLDMKKLELLDVNLVEKNVEKVPQKPVVLGVRQSSLSLADDDDLDPSLFQSFLPNEKEPSPLLNPTSSPLTKSLVRFSKKASQHYCGNVLLRISSSAAKPSKEPESATFQKHNFYARGAEKRDGSKILNHSLRVEMTNASEANQNRIEVELKHVSVMLDLAVARDLTNILHPIFSYKNIINGITLNREEVLTNQDNAVRAPAKEQNKEQEQEPEPELSEMTEEQRKLYYSKYDYSLDGISKEKELSSSVKHSAATYTNIEIGSIVFGVRNVYVGRGLPEKARNKFEDCESFEHTTCFCHYRGTALVSVVDQCQAKVTSKKRISLKSVKLNLVELDAAQRNCPTVQEYPLLLLVQNNDKSVTRIYVEERSNCQWICVSLPKVVIPIENESTLKALQLASEAVIEAKELLGFYKFMKEEMRRLDPNSKDLKKLKKQQSLPAEDPTKAVQIVFHLNLLHVHVLGGIMLLVKDIAVSVKPKQIAVLISDILLLSRRNKRLALHSIDPKDPQLSYYDSMVTDLSSFDMPSNYPTEQIVLHIRNSQPLKVEKLTSSADHRQHSKAILSMNASVSIKISQKSAAEQSKYAVRSNLNRSQMAPKLGRIKGLEPIAEEQGLLVDTQVLDVRISAPIVIRVCDIVASVLPLQEFIEGVSAQASKIESLEEPKLLGSRKNSEEIAITRQQITLWVRQLELDIFPTFQEKEDAFTSILLNSRSITALRQTTLKVTMASRQTSNNVREPRLNIKGDIQAIELWFLVFRDKNIGINPLFVGYADLAAYGFKRLAYIDKLDVELAMVSPPGRQNKNEVVVIIKEIVYESSSRTLVHLISHFACFAERLSPENRPVQQPKGGSAAKMVMEIPDEESSAEDFDRIEKELQEADTAKKLEENEFRYGQMELIPKVGGPLQTVLHLKMFDIKKFSATIFEGDEYDFLEPMGAELSNEVVIFLNDDVSFDRAEELEPHICEQAPVKRPPLKRLCKDLGRRSTNLRVILQDLCLEARKYAYDKPKDQTQEELNLVAMVHAGSINCLINTPGEEIFVLVKTTSKLTLLVEVEGPKIKVKCCEPRMLLGFTSRISFLTSEMEAAEQSVEKSYFRRVLKQPVEKVEEKQGGSLELFVLIPECTLTLNLQLKGFRMLSNQIMRMPEFYFRNRVCKYMEGDNRRFVKGWVTDVFTKNLGSLLGNSLVTLIGKSIELIMLLFKKIVLLPHTAVRLLRR